MASTDARPVPQKNVAYRLTFPILDADGDLVTGATGLDSEVSKDGGTFADAGAEATEIATSSGMYFLDLTSTEMNADTVAVIVKTSSAGAKTTPIVMYPEEAGDIRVNLTQWSGAAPNALASGRVDASVGAMAADVVTAASIAAGAIDAATFAAGAIDAAAIANGAIDAATFAAGAIDAAAVAVSGADKILGAVSGTADSGSTTTVVDTERTEADTDYWKGALIVFTSGTLAGQTRLVTAFNAATDTLTFAPALTIAAGTHTYRLLPAGRADVHFWLGALVNALASGRIDASVGNMAADVVTASAIATDAIGSDEFSQAAADKVWSTATRTLTAFSTTLALSVWDVLESAIATASSIGLKVKTNLDAVITSRATPAEVKTQVVDALNVDTYSEPSQEAPPVSTTLQRKISYLYKFMRNRVTSTASQITVYADDGTTVHHKSSHTDDGTTYDRPEFVSGP